MSAILSFNLRKVGVLYRLLSIFDYLTNVIV